jgi:ferredoxin--NADP+ reductase
VSVALIRAKTRLSESVTRFDIEAARIAQVRRPGQFVIVRLGDGAERIPLTIAAADANSGTITLIIQAVGKSTADLCDLEVGDEIRDIAGPLGMPTDLLGSGHAVCVGGGVGTAVTWPIATALAANGVTVTSIVGARTASGVLLAEELAALGDVIVCTEDGSAGRTGLVTDALADVVATQPVDRVYAVGPVAMMRACAELTRPLHLDTVVSLNSIMLDGTGMCGGCRVSIDGRAQYACVDGPEFDGHAVDFDSLADRLTTYASFEAEAMRRRACQVEV